MKWERQGILTDIYVSFINKIVLFIYKFTIMTFFFIELVPKWAMIAQTFKQIFSTEN